MTNSPRICVLILVYEIPPNFSSVITDAVARHPTVIVNAGTIPMDVIRENFADTKNIHFLELRKASGRGTILKAAFREANTLGFTHTIALEADAPHRPEDLDLFAASCLENPDALIVGSRNLKQAGAPALKRFARGLSNLGFRFETSIHLHGSPSHLRCYPLAPVTQLLVRADGYTYDLEVLVKSAWSGVPIVENRVSPDVAYVAPKVLHRRTRGDLLRVWGLHTRLFLLSFCSPPMLRRISASGEWHRLPRHHKLRELCQHFFTEHTESAGQISSAIGWGLFFGTLPIWGLQMIAAAAFAHRFRLNKALTLAASNFSFPLMAPFIVAGGLWLGHYVHTGSCLEINLESARDQIPQYFGEWFFGSIALAVIVGLLGAFLSWILCVIFRQSQVRAGKD